MLLAAGFQISSLAMLLLVGVATTTLMMRLHIARRKQQLAAQGESPSFGRGQAAVESSEAMRRQVEIYDLAREAQARLDNKIVILQQLLAAADQRIARLSELETEWLHVGPRKAVVEAFDAEDSDDFDPVARDSARYAVVFGMADAGHNPMSIARRLTLPLGEVELMLSLRRKLPERPAA